jgi:hypothetical protein
MRVKVVLQKVYVAFVLLVLLTIQVSIPVVNANDQIDGSVTSFGFNNPTTISNVVIKSSGNLELVGSGIANAALTRTSSFVIEFDVFDLDGFDHLDVYVAFFNTNGSEAEESSGILISAINSGVEDRGFVVRWLAPERSSYLSGLTETFAFPIDSGVGVSNFLVKSGINPINSGTYNSGLVDFVTPVDFNENAPGTWQVTSGVSPSAVVSQSGVVTYNDPVSSGVRNIKYTVRIPFVLSKVAPSSGVWNLGVMVHDRLQQEITTERTDVLEDHYQYTAEYYKNQWYGEVLIEGNDQITFTDVPAGSGFQIADQSGITSGIQVRFISNGTYNQQVQSDTTWTPNVTIPNRPVFAYLTTISGLDEGDGNEILTSSGNRFALQARRIKIGSTESSLSFVDIIPKAFDSEDLIVLANDDPAYRQPGEGIGDILASRIGPIASAPGTNEVGVLSIFEFQLRLSSVFQNTTYTGNITIGVSNVTEGSSFFTP